MLADAPIVAFAATADAPRARRFYGEVLGLPLRTEDDFALVFDAAGSELRIQKLDHLAPQPFTVLGWRVTGIDAIVDRLTAAGVVTKRYDWLQQDARGIWRAPSGARIAWFEDPDGNLLSVSEVRGK